MIKTFLKLKSILLREEKRKLLFFSFFITLLSLLEIVTLIISFSVLSILFSDRSDTPATVTFEVFSRLGTTDLVLILLGVTTLKFVSSFPIHFYEAKLKTQISTRLSTKLFTYYLHFPYIDFISSEKAALLRNIQDTHYVVVRSILTPLMFMAESLLLIGFIVLLFITTPTYSLAGVATIGLVGLTFSKLTSAKASNYGDAHNKFSKFSSINTQEGLNSGAEVRMLNTQEYFVDKFSKACFSRLKALSTKEILDNISPKGLEFILIAGISLTILIVESLNDSSSNTLQILSIVFLGALRTVPSVGKLNQYLGTMRFGSAAALDLANELSHEILIKQSEMPESKLSRNSDLYLQSVNFGYPNMNNRLILKDFNAVFKFGEITAIVGPNGAGKTSLINLLTGLFEPQSGEIFLKDENISSNSPDWKNNIGFVSQDSSLINSTIFENVVFGRSGISDLEIKVNKALITAGLSSFTNGLTLGQSYLIGENGNKLSGGERQKLGIARAILLNPSILIFDELSNFLDNLSVDETIKILESFREKHTVILVTHDKRLLAIADQVIEIRRESTVLL